LVQFSDHISSSRSMSAFTFQKLQPDLLRRDRDGVVGG
jgi:hypothetical protein